MGIQVHDFAGGSLLHIAAAVSAFAIVMIIGGHAHFPLKRLVLHIKNVAHAGTGASSASAKTNSRNAKSRLSRALWADVAKAQDNSSTESVVSSVATVAEVAETSSQSSVENGSVRHPHNVPFVMLGIFLIWFGWLGLMIGSSAGVPGVAGYAWVSSTITASASMLAWGVTERLRSGCFSALGAASGVMAGLSASAAAADVIAPLWALVLGVLSGVITSLVTHSRTFARYDGALHVVSVNGVAALIGVISVGLFADGSGLLSVGDWHQLVAQLCLIGITVLYSGAVTAIVAFALEKLFGWRISEAKERKGVDLADQGERAYDFSAIAQSHEGAVVAVSDDESSKTQMAVLTSVDIAVDDNSLESESASADKQADLQDGKESDSETNDESKKSQSEGNLDEKTLEEEHESNKNNKKSSKSRENNDK